MASALSPLPYLQVSQIILLQLIIVISHTNLNTSKKRSFKRALKRAVINGGAWFKGQFLRPSDVGIPLAAEARPSQNEFKWQSPQSSLHKPQNRISVFQWNVDGLMKNQFDDLQFWMKQQLYDVAILTETRWSFTSEWSNDDWYFIHSGSF